MDRLVEVGTIIVEAEALHYSIKLIPHIPWFELKWSWIAMGGILVKEHREKSLRN